MMDHRKRLATALFLLLAAVMFLNPGTAQAQTFPCTWGPGEVQVGVNNGVPLCQQRGSSGTYAPPTPVYAIDNYSAAAWHADSADVWMVGGFSSEGRAVAAAIASCNQAMGGGCTKAASNVNGGLAIARGVEGGLYARSDRNDGNAKRGVLKHCKSQGDECIVINSMMSRPGRTTNPSRGGESQEFFPPHGDFRSKYAAAAWVDGTKLAGRPWSADVWFSGGHGSRAQAQQAAQTACEQALRSPCLVAMTVANTMMVVSQRDGSNITLGAGPTEAMATARSMAECRKIKGKCSAAGTFTAYTQGTIRHDPLAFGKPWHSAQTWIKGSVPQWANMVWSVSGARSESDAKQAALAQCKRVSRQDCEVGSSSFNAQSVVYRDNTNMIWISRLDFGDNPQRYVEDKCREKKVTCRIITTIDSRMAATQQIDAR